MVANVLHVMAINGESRQTLLGVRSQHSRQIHRAGPLGAVEAPHRLNGLRIHVEGFHAVAPARGDGQSRNHVLGGEELLALGGFCAAADGAGANDDLHRRAIGIVQGFHQFLCSVGKAHGLLFQTFANAAPAAINGGTNTDLGINHVYSSSEYFL